MEGVGGQGGRKSRNGDYRRDVDESNCGCGRTIAGAVGECMFAKTGVLPDSMYDQALCFVLTGSKIGRKTPMTMKDHGSR